MMTSLRISDDLRAWISRHLCALVLQETQIEQPSFILVPAILAFHLAGIFSFVYLARLSYWLILILFTSLLVFPLFTLYSRRRSAIETLAPMFFLYTIIAARFIFIRTFGGNVPGYFDYNLPDLRSTFFRLEPWAIIVIGYTLVLQVYRVWRIAYGSLRFVNGLAIALVLVAVLWSTMVYLGGRTHGVTGTDPFAYAQMGIDMATGGTPLHRFTLFSSIASLNIPWSPMVHTGYHIPINSNGDAPTVWPIGGAFAFALAYRLIGEPGLYLVNPLTSLLLLAVIGWLVWELFHDSKYRWWLVALSIAILATSHTLFDWATVPMVDSQAALFSALAIILSLRAAKRRSNLPLALLAGLSLGMAYFVRHTQVLIMPAMLVLLWFNDALRNERIRNILAMCAGALFVATFDLWYHQLAFGGWFNVESTELNLFSLDTVLATTQAILTQLFAAYEFGWLLPFLIYGTYRLVYEKRIVFIALALWFLIVVVFHLPYPALRLRDLLSEFVPLIIVTAYGAIAFIEMLWRNNRPLIPALGLIVTLWLLLIRVWNVIPLAWSAPQISFGYVTAEQRASFATISRLVPSRGVVGSSLNTGAIELYAHREIFHPGMWSAQEQDAFIAEMFREGRGVYLLEDGDAMREARNTLSSRYKLEYVTIIDAPYFGNVGAMSGVLWKITQ